MTNKFLRVLGWTVVSFISIIVIIPVGVFLYFDPNDYKAEISNFITEKSGLPLEINGAIELKLFPWLGFTVSDVKGNFVSIEKLDLKIPVKELFHHQLIVETLHLEGLNLNLVKNEDGTTNWENAGKQIKQKANDKNSSANDNTRDVKTSSNSKKKLSFALAHFDISEGSVTYQDKTQGDVLSITHLQLKGKQGKEKSEFPVEGKFEVSQNGSSLALRGAIDFKGSVTFAEKISAIATTKLKLDLPQNPEAFRKVDAELQISLTPNNVINLKDIRLKVGEQLITGKATVPQDSNAPITFALKTNELDLNKLTKQSSSTEAPTKDKSTSKQTAKVPAKTTKSTTSRAITGEVVIDKLITSNIQMTNVRALINKTNNLVNINPLTATLYQGSLTAKISKDLNNSAPVLIQGDLNNIQIQPLLMSLKNEKRLSGVANINFNLAQNHDINGVVKVAVKNGVLDGIDVKHYLTLAQSLISKDKTPSEDTKKTPFGNLSATLKIHDQMIDNNDLSLTAPDFKASGEGSIYLGSKTIEYKMQAWRVHSDNQVRENDYPLAIRIKGPLDHPKIEPDVDVYLKKGLEQEIKKQLGKQVEKNIGKILGSPSQTEAQPGDANNELQQKIEDKINKGLNKLFKKKE
ncbi:MAG: AsmA family protein [Proteobacteria bacterium]|nr:AsmA family protein [Pseudomonadota bacterium]